MNTFAWLASTHAGDDGMDGKQSESSIKSACEVIANVSAARFMPASYTHDRLPLKISLSTPYIDYHFSLPLNFTLTCTISFRDFA